MRCSQEPDIWESLLPRQLALQLARLFKTACLPARTAAHALLGAMFQKTATQLPSPQAALLLSAIWHEVIAPAMSMAAFAFPSQVSLLLFQAVACNQGIIGNRTFFIRD